MKVLKGKIERLVIGGVEVDTSAPPFSEATFNAARARMEAMSRSGLVKMTATIEPGSVLGEMLAEARRSIPRRCIRPALRDGTDCIGCPLRERVRDQQLMRTIRRFGA